MIRSAEGNIGKRQSNCMKEISDKGGDGEDYYDQHPF